MTDSIVQFKFADEKHMVAIYIKSDTHQENFIPFLMDVVNNCQRTHEKRGWYYVVNEMVARITSKHNANVGFLLESQLDNFCVIYRYEISIKEEAYNSKDSHLSDYLTIKEVDKNKKYCFSGLLKDFSAQIIDENNSYLILDLENAIAEKQKKLNELRSK